MLVTVGVFFALLGSATALAEAGPPSGDGVVPIGTDGNPKCPPGLTELKVEGGDLNDGTYNDGTLSVTLDFKDSPPLGRVVDWQSNIGVDQVIVKGGPNANVYTYSPDDTTDTALHPPINPNNGKYYGFSHISFCYDGGGPPPPSGTVTIKKETDPDGAAQSFSFTGDGPIGSFFLQDGGTHGPTIVSPGQYEVTESLPADWLLESIVCSDKDDQSGASSVAGPKVTVDVQDGEDVVCTFFNKASVPPPPLGTIIVEKQTDPDGAVGVFGFTGTAPVGNFSLSDGQQRPTQVQPGSYDVSENDPSGLGFALSNVVCDDGLSTGPSTIDVASSKATFNVESGETVTCVFTNTQIPTPPGPPTPTPTQPGQQQAQLPAQLTPGSAVLASPSGCAGRTFRASVRGSKIASVRFSVDGKRIKTVTRPDAQGRYSVKVNTRKLRSGAHKLKVQVTYTAQSSVRSQSLRRTFQRCGAVQPRFTG